MESPRPPHRPRPLTGLLAPPSPAADSKPARRQAKPQRGYSLTAEKAFAQGLAHASTYYKQHQHLAVAAHDTPGGYPLGQWLTNKRTAHTRMPPHQAAALTALYPWWNAPWSMQWQRTWHEARNHTTAHGPLQPAAGFPSTSHNLGDWLYLQCTAYQALHPEQQHLLAQIGIDAPAAATARPRRRSLKASAEQALARARSYAAEHGHLAAPITTVHEGFRLGQWLSNQRGCHRGHRPLPANRVQALTAIDPWWCPPWNIGWQRVYHRIRSAGSNRLPHHSFTSFAELDPADADWLRQQCATYDELHPDQQHLLTDIGLTPHMARTARDQAPTAHGHRPDPRRGFETALTHARAWHTEHGHLATPRDTRHDGYPLGMWLFSQRNRAKQRARASLPPSPHLSKLAAIDPWWNPPWNLHWQRNYYRARNHVEAGKPFAPAELVPDPRTTLGSWITRACLRYDQLHPDQQHLLTLIGITPAVAHARIRRAHPWRTAVEHAQSYASIHGHLAVPRDTRQDGFPLGSWLSQLRYRTKTNGPTPAVPHLTAIDPWWNPPWGMVWQRAYHHARTRPDAPASRRWLRTQHTAWPRLHPAQHTLLVTTGLVTG